MDSDKNIDADYEFSRATYYNLIMKGSEALDRMMEIADQTEHPRSYEVLSTLIGQLSLTNDKLMDLNKKRKDIKSKGLPALPPASNVTQNNLFVGSTTDLQRMLANNLKPADPNIIDINEIGRAHV